MIVADYTTCSVISDNYFMTNPPNELSLQEILSPLIDLFTYKTLVLSLAVRENSKVLFSFEQST